jgi:thrombospondin 2/3/4/5
MIDFPAAKNKFTFYLDRKAKRVTIDINSNSQIFSKHLIAPSLNETTTIRSLAIGFSENTVSLFIDCKDVFKDEMEFNLSKLYLNMDEPDVKLLRERKYPLYLDRSVEGALARANCQKSSKQKGNRKMMKDREYYNGRKKMNRPNFLFYSNHFYHTLYNFLSNVHHCVLNLFLKNV